MQLKRINGKERTTHVLSTCHDVKKAMLLSTAMITIGPILLPSLSNVAVAASCQTQFLQLRSCRQGTRICTNCRYRCGISRYGKNKDHRNDQLLRQGTTVTALTLERNGGLKSPNPQDDITPCASLLPLSSLSPARHP